MGTPANALNLVILVDTAAGNAALQQFNVQLSNVERTAIASGQRAAGGFDRMNSSARVSSETFRGFGEEIGVRIPRFVSSFVSSMLPVGGIMEAAFSAVAVVGLVEVLLKVPNAVNEIVLRLHDMTEAEQKVFEETHKHALEMQADYRNFQHEVDAVSTVGTEGAGKFRIEAGNLGAQIRRDSDDIEKLRSETDQLSVSNKRLGENVHFWNTNSAQMTVNTEKMKQNTAEINRLVNDREKLQKVEAPKLSIESTQATNDVNRQIVELERKADVDRLQNREKALAQIRADEDKDIDEYVQRRDRRGLTDEQYARMFVARHAIAVGEAAAVDRQYDAEHERSLDRIAEIERSADAAGLNRHALALAQTGVEEQKQVDLFKKQKQDGVVSQAEFDRAIVALDAEAAGKRVLIEEQFGRERDDLLNHIHDRAAEAELQASDSIIQQNRANLLQINAQERDELDKLKDAYKDGLINYKDFQDAQTQVARASEAERVMTVKSFGRELEGMYDRDIGRAKSASDALKNIWGEYLNYIKSKAFEKLAGILLGPPKGIPSTSSSVSFPGMETGGKLNQPNHLGDVTLVTGGAVPVAITNLVPDSRQPGSPGVGLGTLAAGLSGLAALGTGVGGIPAGSVSSTIDYGSGAMSTGAASVYPGSPATPPFFPSSGAGSPGGGGILGSLASMLGLGGRSSGSTGGVTGAANHEQMLSGLLHGAALMGGTAALSYGMQHPKAASGTASTIGGAAATGYGIAPMLGASGLWGAALGVGAGLAINGLQRGGIAGLAETTAGGALVGFQLGGPIGAAIGAVAGAVAGGLRMLFKTATEKVRQKIKDTYGVDIRDQNILQQVVQYAKQTFGGNLDVAIQSPQIRDMISLYALTTGQKTRGLPAQNRPTSIMESGGSVFQGQGGVFSPISLDSTSAGKAATGGAQIMSTPVNMHLDGKVLAQVTVQTVLNNGRAVSAASASGLKASASRREQTILQLSPRTLAG